MSRSIRRQFTMIFIGLMTGVLVAIWAVNGFLLEPYYTSQKVKVMEHAYEEINGVLMEKISSGESIGAVISREMQRQWEIWSEITEASEEDQEESQEENQEENQDDPLEKAENEENQPSAIRRADEAMDETTRREIDNSLVGTIRRYGDENNMMIVLIDSDTGKALLNSGRESDFLARKVQRYVLGQGDDSHTDLLVEHENYVIEKNSDRRSDSSYLESWGFFSDNNTLFLMQMPIASIRDSVALSNRFVTFVGLFALILGGIVMYFVTRKVTDPIMKLAALSERMSCLDFDARYEGEAQNEVGVLGRSMNVMSEKLKKTIEELQDANSQLQQDIQEKIEIDEMRKEFIANVSHELKTPIALIQGYAEGLTEGMAEEKESRDYYCEVIMDEAAKMNKMVKQLLTLTALEFGNDMPVMEVFDLTELTRDVISSASILIQQKGANVEFSGSKPVFVRADEFKIEEVLTNYISNALNHLDGERLIRIEVKEEQEQAVVRVFNTGSPIPEEALPNLWTKFYKVDKARTRAYGGSGIGLSIVKAILDAHHQTCGVSNREDGVEFWFTLQLGKDGGTMTQQASE